MQRWLLIVGVGALALLGWRNSRPAAVPAPVVQAPPVTEEAIAEAATATLAVALIASGAAIETRPDLDPFGLEVSRIARGYLLRPPPGFRDDCSGFASAVYTQAGVPMDYDVWGMWDRAGVNSALHWGTPRVGDLVFFDDTTDRNRDGEWNDDLTHVGVVIDIEPDDTILFAHSGTSAGRTIGALNLDNPATDRAADGHRINSWLREPHPGDPPTASYLAGDLWAGFARIDPGDDWL